MTGEPPVTRWWWIRHAPVVGQQGRLYGTLDVDCDCADEAPLRTLAAQLPAGAEWVVTSLKRTRATAAAIARHHSAAPQDFHVEPRLVEQDFGRWQGRTYDELAAAEGAAWQRFWRAPAENAPPGGESFAAVVRRTADVIDTLTRRHAGRDIVCIAHGGTVRAALAVALSLAPEQALRFAVDPCSLTRLDHCADGALPGKWNGDSWRIALVNHRG